MSNDTLYNPGRHPGPVDISGLSDVFHSFSNIIVTYKGRLYPEEIIVIGAHYDTVLGTPGADDNAGAVAMLLELARIQAGSKSERTLNLVFLAWKNLLFSSRKIWRLCFCPAGPEKQHGYSGQDFTGNGRIFQQHQRKSGVSPSLHEPFFPPPLILLPWQEIFNPKIW